MAFHLAHRIIGYDPSNLTFFLTLATTIYLFLLVIALICLLIVIYISIQYTTSLIGSLYLFFKSFFLRKKRQSTFDAWVSSFLGKAVVNVIGGITILSLFGFVLKIETILDKENFIAPTLVFLEFNPNKACTNVKPNTMISYLGDGYISSVTGNYNFSIQKCFKKDESQALTMSEPAEYQ